MPDSPLFFVGVSTLLGSLFLATSAGKLAGAKASLQIRDSLSLSALQWRLIGAVELPIAVALIVGVWKPAVGTVALGSVCVLMLGAIAARVRVGGAQRNPGVVVDVIVIALAAAAIFV